MAKAKTVKVVQDEADPIPVSVLARAITDISAAGKRLAASGLNRKAVVILIAHDTNLGQGVVRAVLDSISDLQRTYLEK
jgi:hypothetical protein